MEFVFRVNGFPIRAKYTILLFNPNQLFRPNGGNRHGLEIFPKSANDLISPIQNYSPLEFFARDFR